MTPPPDLAGLIAYVRSRDRQHSIDGRLLAEVDRLTALLRRWTDLDGDTDDIAALIAETRDATKEPPDV